MPGRQLPGGAQATKPLDSRPAPLRVSPFPPMRSTPSIQPGHGTSLAGTYRPGGRFTVRPSRSAPDAAGGSRSAAATVGVAGGHQCGDSGLAGLDVLLKVASRLCPLMAISSGALTFASPR